MIGFGLPALLPLALLATIPVIIHIISRARLRRLEFPSLRLLESVSRERIAWSRLKEIILLALRTLALLALLLALARPWYGSGVGSARPDLVLLLDDSYSMQHGSTWDRACSLARELVLGGPSDSRVLLLTASAPESRTGVMSPAAAAGLLAAIPPSNTAARVMDALPEAIRLADSLDARLVVVTDLQRRSLSGDWSALPGRDLLLLDAGSDAPGNLALTEIALERPMAVLDRPVTVRLRLANYSPEPAVARVLLETEGRPQPGDGTTVNLAPGQTRELTAEVRFDRAGPALVTARLLSLTDSLELDNARYLAVDVRDSLRILVVGSPGVTSRHTVAALTADRSGIISIAETPRAELGRSNLRRYDAVVVQDALALQPGDWTRLLFGLAGGTGLIFMTGPTTSLPARLAGFAHTTGSLAPSGFLTITDADTLHPVFAGIDPALWQAPRFQAVTRLQPDSARILARFNDRSPFLLEAAAGRVLIWATGPDVRFTDLVRRAAFVPLLLSSVEHVAIRGRVQARHVSDTLRFPAEQAGPAVLTTPELTLPLETGSHDGRPVYQHHDTRLPGGYRLNSATTNELLALAAVNIDPEESNLERIRPDELPETVRVVRAVNGSRDLTFFLLLLAAAAFAAELILLLL